MGNRVWWHCFSFFTIPQHAQWKKCQDTWFNNLLFSWISNQIWSSLPDKVLLTGSQIVNTRNDVFTGKFAFISLFLCRPMNRHILKSVWVLKMFFHRLTLCSESLLLLMKQKKKINKKIHQLGSMSYSNWRYTLPFANATFQISLPCFSFS